MRNHGLMMESGHWRTHSGDWWLGLPASVQEQQAEWDNSSLQHWRPTGAEQALVPTPDLFCYKVLHSFWLTPLHYLYFFPSQVLQFSTQLCQLVSFTRYHRLLNTVTFRWFYLQLCTRKLFYYQVFLQAMTPIKVESMVLNFGYI